MRGHKLAQLDPLGLSSADLDAERPQDLTYKFYNFSKRDSLTLLLVRTCLLSTPSLRSKSSLIYLADQLLSCSHFFSSSLSCSMPKSFSSMVIMKLNLIHWEFSMPIYRVNDPKASNYLLIN